MTLTLDMIQSMALAVVILMAGQAIRKRVSFLERFCIPAPVIGGIIFALFTLVMKQTGVLEFQFDTTLQKVFMTAFFTTVGFTASFKLLKKGGKQVMIFLILAIVLVCMQNVVGVGFAKVFGINPLIGLSTGSVPMTGGHGTSGAYAPVFENAGATGANAVAMASATFGLIAGSLIGGPLGKKLIEKHDLLSKKTSSQVSDAQNETEEVNLVSSSRFLGAACQIIVAMGLGTIVSALLSKTGMTFPPYIGAMFAAAIIRNISDASSNFKINSLEIDVIGETSLSIFLAMALMSLKLWQLADLAGPMLVMLVAQVTLMGLFAYFVTFNVMGRDYEAAVMACGHCGFGMGATPNAMANMSALTQKYEVAPAAFFILPLVGSLFIDFFNAAIITGFMNLFV
ncbi:sodium/glutamate symporter [Fusibacter sp. JL216-2]|uniref:sodium/glutamate symporter n=1 Tax=Fusibacter sp. JL216-2 TaxID=3071453 RepID=UPI003D32DFC4